MVDWQRVLAEFVATVGGGGVCLAAAAWLLRTVIADRLKANSDIEIARVQNALSRDLKAFEMQLKSRSDVEIERLKTALQVNAAEHQIRFSKMHERQADVIAEVYKLLVQAQRDGLQYIYQLGKVPPEKEGAEPPAIQSLRTLDGYLDTHRIYLSEKTCNLLENISEKLRGPAVHARVYGGINYPNPDTAAERNAGFKKAFDEFSGAIPAARRALEEELRGILGVSSQKE